MTAPVRRLFAPAERIVDALADPARRHRAMLALAAAYGLAWTLYATVGKSSQDLNADMAEMVQWAQHPAWGYPKHPPLLGWILTGWFAVFPNADWAYYLLSGLTLGVGLYVAFVLAGEWMEGDKRAAVPFLLAVIPFYNFLGLKWDQNSTLIPLWGLTLWAFMRSLDTRRPGWAVLAGLAAAASLLTKYWSAFLITGLVVAALVDRRRDPYFKSGAPWLSALVGGVAIAPHAIWLVQNGFPPMQWAGLRRAAHSLTEWLSAAFEYIAGTVGYAGLALLLVLVLAWPSRKAIRDSWLPHDKDRRTAAALFYVPILLPMLPAAVTARSLLSLWNTPALNLLPVIMLASPLILLTRAAVIRMAAATVTVTIMALLVSPIVAAAILKLGTENDAAFGRLVAAALEREWEETSPAPLRIVGGPFALVSTASFYVHGRPSSFADFSRYLSPWVDEASIAREGIAMVCPVDQTRCLDEMNRLAAHGPAGRRSEVVLTRHWLFLESAPARFVIETVPPQS